MQCKGGRLKAGGEKKTKKKKKKKRGLSLSLEAPQPRSSARVKDLPLVRHSCTPSLSPSLLRVFSFSSYIYLAALSRPPGSFMKMSYFLYQTFGWLSFT